VSRKDALFLFKFAIEVFVELNDFSALLLDCTGHPMYKHVPPDLVVSRLHFRLVILCFCFGLRLELLAVLESHGKDFFAVFNDLAGTPEQFNFIIGHI
jgi:hypothetical protein